MKILFVKDTPPMSQTGNEHYRPGMDADLRDGWAMWLIEQGYARPHGHIGVPGDMPPADEPVAYPTPNYADMPLSELRSLARERGVYQAKMRKADLVTALEDSDG